MCVTVQKFRNFAPVSLPKVKKAAFNTELRKQGSHRTIRRSFNLPSSQIIIVFHTYCSIIGHSIIRRSIKCRVYVLTYLLSVASLFCLSMFCRTANISFKRHNKLFHLFPFSFSFISFSSDKYWKRNVPSWVP